MKMHRLMACVLLCVALSACTMFYTREYIVEPAQELTAAETKAVFRAFRDFLVSKGLNPLSYGEKTDPNRVAFRIGGSNKGFALRHDWEDILELTYSGENSFRLRLMRIVHHPDDFTDEYLKRFVEQTEGFIREATSKPVRLRLVPSQRT